MRIIKVGHCAQCPYRKTKDYQYYEYTRIYPEHKCAEYGKVIPPSFDRGFPEFCELEKEEAE